MNIAATTPVAPTPAAPAPSATSPIVSDYQTFLLMMTTQIQNQDPLEPMESSELAVQLATFAGVEQQTLTNDLLASMSMQMNATGMASMAAWVGNEARFAAPAYFDGTSPITLSPNPAMSADKAVLVVTDQEGNEVAREEIPVTSADYEWQGLDANGEPLPEGIYSFTLESWLGEEQLGVTEVEHYSEVEEIRSGPSGTTIMVEGGIEVPTLLVTGLRPPEEGSVSTTDLTLY
jgi:flagellar basal-body rod modification protein FlgD